MQQNEEQYSTFMKEISEISTSENPAATNGGSTEDPWQQCYDENSGCYYHWNILTNEVSWELPSGKYPGNKPEHNQSEQKSKLLSSLRSKEKDNISNVKSVNKEINAPENNINKPRALSALVGYMSDSDISDDDNDGKVSQEEKVCQENTASQNKIISMSSVPESTSPKQSTPTSPNKESINLDNIKKYPCTKENTEVTSAPTIVDTGHENSVKLVDCSSDESDSETPMSFKIDKNATFSGAFSGAFHWSKPVTSSNDLDIDESEKNVKKESSKDIFKRAVEETYGETPAPILKKPKRINFVKSNEVLDLNKMTEVAPKILKEEENLKDKDVVSDNQIEDNNSATTDFDDVEAALTRALEEHNSAQNEKKNTTISTVVIENPILSDEKPIEDDSMSSKTETMLQKLNALNSQIQFSYKIYKLFIELQTRNEDWKLKVLDESYFTKCAENCSAQLDVLEKEVMPPEWSCHWDRNYKMYFFQNKNENLCQWEFPIEKSEEKDTSPCDIPPIPKTAPIPEKPPLPLSPPPPEIAPPLPPSPTLPDPPPLPVPDSSSPDNTIDFATDMDIEPSADSPQMELSAAAQTNVYPAQSNDQNVSNATVPENVTLSDNVEIHETPIVPTKKRKRIKLNEGLTLKNKQMKSLVEKWVKIKQETES